MWTIFSGRREEKGLWGFNLSARQGRRLRKIINESSEPVILHAEVDADLIEGTSDLVNALLPELTLHTKRYGCLLIRQNPAQEITHRDAVSP